MIHPNLSRARSAGEKGQILVIFVGSLVMLLLIAALVIDLGITFAIGRMEQNIADPAAIAAARYIRTGPTPDTTGMVEAACSYARRNGLFPSAANDDQCIQANDPDGTTLTVNYPPSSSGGTFAGREGFVEVVIGRQYHTSFANVIGISQIGVASSAVAAFSAGDSNSSSLIALDPGLGCSAGRTHGGGNINIHPVAGVTNGGYVHVNGTCAGTTGTSCTTSPKGALDITGLGSLTAPHTYVTGTCKQAGTSTNPIGLLTEGAVQIGDPLIELPPPAFGIPSQGAECGVGSGVFTYSTGPGAGGCKFSGIGTVNLNPGVYYGGWSIQSKVQLVLAAGIYVIAGGGINVTGTNNTITDVQSSTGTYAPVMIFNTDNPVTHTGQADVKFNAQSTLKLHATATNMVRSRSAA